MSKFYNNYSTNYSTLPKKWVAIFVFSPRISGSDCHLFELPFVREKVAAVSKFCILVSSKLQTDHSESPLGPERVVS